MATIDLSKVKYSVVAILADGRQLHLDEVAENIAWEENEKELAVRLNLALRDVPHDDGRLSSLLALCTVVYLYADWGDGQQEIFRGTIWEWEHSQIKDDVIILTAYDLLYYLQKSTDSKYYAKGKKTKAIISDILSTWQVPMGEYTAPDLAHKKILYKNKTIAAMLTETLEDAKKLGGEKSFVRATKGKADVVKRGSNTTVYAFTADANLIQSKDKYSMTGLVTRVIITGKDDKQGRPKVEAKVDGKTEYGILQSVITKGSSSLKEAKKEAQELLDEKGKPERTITLQAPDFPAIRKGDMIHATTDRLTGYFYVKGVSHNATNMAMQMEVEPA
jgi:hypothetical protein